MTRRRRFLSPHFVVSAGFLALTAAALPTGLAMLKEHMRKVPVELTVKLDQLDKTAFPSFRYDSSVQTVLAIDEWLGTKDWVSFGYRLESPPTPEAAGLGVTLFVAYYNDPEETVPHTPEVCYKQSGWDVRPTRRLPITIDGVGTADAHLVDVSMGSERVVVLYYLCHNRQLFRTREEVRFAMGLPGDPYMYFSKIESIVVCPPDVPVETCVDTAKRMLEEAMPHLLEAHFPDTSAEANADRGDA